MAELEGTSQIVPVNAAATESYAIQVKDYDAAGKMSTLTCELPNGHDFAKWTVMQQIVMLKKGMWKTLAPADIMWGLAYANRIGADVVKGELFPTGEGRWGTSNKFKIRKALESGMITGIKSEMKELAEAMPAECIQKKDLECTVTIGVKGWEAPIVRKARLSRWYKKSNPNWVTNPEHMLELNTMAHACELIVPQGAEDDELPTAVIVERTNEISIGKGGQ